MTGKDYTKIADLIKDEIRYYSYGREAYIAAAQLATLRGIAERLAREVFAPDDPDFDRARFLQACGIKSRLDLR